MRLFKRRSSASQIKPVRSAIEPLESRTLFAAVPATITVTVPRPIPTQVIAGAVVHDKIGVNIADNDVVRARGRVMITLFASVDQTLSNDDFQIQPPTPAGINIASGRNHTVRVNVKAFPQNLNGSYYILAEVTGTGVNTATAASVTQAGIEQPEIDLAGVVTKAPGNGHVGHRISVSVQVTNDGNVTAKGKLAVNFGESISPSGSSPINLATLGKHINLKPEELKVLNFSVPIPLGVPTGNQYVVADVDPSDVFNDSNLANNVNTYQTAITIT